MKMYSASKINLIAFLIFTLICGCSQTMPITKDQLKEILDRPLSTWTVEECDIIITTSSVSNAAGMSAKQIYDDVYIRATILDDISISAIVRKEAILKRLSARDFTARLTIYLEAFTNYTIDTKTAEIAVKHMNKDLLKGRSFQITLQNVSNPYRSIYLEDGYSYFFLENDKGEFARVTEISGDFADNHLVLADYLKVNVTFSRQTDDGKELFPSESMRTGYKLIFNGLQKDPIVLEY